MACACNKNRANAAALAAGITYVYDFTPPDAPGTVITYGTPIEGKMAVRQHGGGRLVRRAVNTAPAPAA